MQRKRWSRLYYLQCRFLCFFFFCCCCFPQTFVNSNYTDFGEYSIGMYWFKLCCTFQPTLRQSSDMSIHKPYKGRYNNIWRAPCLQVLLHISIYKNVTVRILVNTDLRNYCTDCLRILTQRSIQTGASVHIYTTSISWEEAVEPETISESYAPITSKFFHNVAFHYARVFTYIHTHTYNCGGSGGALNIVTLNTYISDSSSQIALKFWHNVAFKYGRGYI
jgi:hypothetical protein